MKKNGFTLIELLVAIAVLTILAVIVISAVSNARNKAKQKAILAEIRGVYQEGELFVIENNGYGPELKTISPCPTSEDETWGFLGTQKGIQFIESIKSKTGATTSADAVCAISPTSWAVSVSVYNPGVLLTSSYSIPFTNEAYAQGKVKRQQSGSEVVGYVCFDNGRHVRTSTNNIRLDSNGDARQDPALPGIAEAAPGVFSCES